MLCARAIACALLALCAGFLSLGARAEPITIFAAASLRGALDDALAGTVPTRVAYAGSAALARQLMAGAPADLFISANTDWMDAAIKAGAVDAASRHDLLTNRLALVSYGGAPGQTPLSPAAVRAAVGRAPLAMALVEAVPAGLYGKAALTSMGVWDALSDQVVQADNVRAALILVARGEAETGIVYATDAALTPQLTIVGLFAPESHPPILYPAALTAAASPQAQAVLSWLTGKEAQAIFRARGFGIP